MSNPKGRACRISKEYIKQIKALSKTGEVDVSGLSRTDKAGLAFLGQHTGLFHYQKKTIDSLVLVSPFEIIGCGEEFIKIVKKT